MDYLQIWDILEEIELRPEEDDVHTWVHSSSAQFSTKYAYRTFFTGAITFEPWKRLWRSWAPLQEENVQHILTGCTFAREVWFHLFLCLGIAHLVPTVDDTVFAEWWRLSSSPHGEAAQERFKLSYHAWSLGTMEAKKCLRL